jgi:hypothetical protein
MQDEWQAGGPDAGTAMLESFGIGKSLRRLIHQVDQPQPSYPR